jgi:hypothetical protein
MLSERMIPFLWLRLVAVIAFTIFVAYQQLWLIAAIGAFLSALTAFQIFSALKHRTNNDGE